MNTPTSQSATPHPRYRKTKIIATLGPASSQRETIRQLIEAGVNVFRLNFSHGSHDAHLALLKLVREVSAELETPVGILQDLSGPKIRISNVHENVVQIKNETTIELRSANGTLSGADVIYVEGLNPTKVLVTGQHALLADGMIELEALNVTPERALCRVIKGGKVRSRVGIAFPDSAVDLPATTEKDLIDLSWGIKNGVDYAAISFVQNAKDISMVRDAIRKANSQVGIIAKIERKTALDNIAEILDASDGVMVARGDLGLELPLEQVPLIQRGLIEAANHRGIPVIVATQMLHSMVTSARPTRAEVSDIANAVMSGADALMLSDETAIGENVVASVEFLGRVAKEAEKTFTFEEYKLRLRNSDSATIPDAVAYAACAAANKVNASAVIACTETGTSARLMSKYRPQQPLYGASPREDTLRRMCLFWGVIPISMAPTKTHLDEIEKALSTVQQREELPNGSWVVITGGVAAGQPGTTSMLELKELVYQ